MNVTIDQPPCYPGETIALHKLRQCVGRCKHDMLNGQCSWCKGLRDVPINWGSLSSRHLDDEPVRPLWISAERADECAACAGEIRKGEPITYDPEHQGWIGRCCGEAA